MNRRKLVNRKYARAHARFMRYPSNSNRARMRYYANSNLSRYSKRSIFFMNFGLIDEHYRWLLSVNWLRYKKEVLNEV